MYISWRSNVRRIARSIEDGKLTDAWREIRVGDVRESPSGKRLAAKLVDALVTRANQSWIAGDFATAWDDLAHASSIAVGRQSARVSQETNRLVDLTIEQADQLLDAGKPAHAEKTLHLLSTRRILDRRADQIGQICGLIGSADQLAAQGQLQQAQQRLRQAQGLRPELKYLETKIQSYEKQQQRLKSLTERLRDELVQSAWSGARKTTNEMLQIAPHHQLALDAINRCQVKENQIHDTQKNGEEPTYHPVGVIADVQDAEESKPASDDMNSFMLWIDGVGGFLVCTSGEIMVGQALPSSGVEIPVHADLRRRHLRIRRLADMFVADPIGYVQSRGQPLKETTLLGDGQTLDLGHGVQLEFRLPSRLGRTARLQFTSRHRTDPWSDAVYLLGDAMKLGPGADCHIHCPEWSDEMVVFTEGSRTLLRGPESKEVNGANQPGDVVLGPDMRVSGEDFAVTVESIR